MKRVNRHPEAEAEAESAADYYDSVSDSAAARFVLDLEAAIAKVRASPRLYPQIGGGLQRARLTDFPYSVIYRETIDEIQIMAIAHAKRRPNYWRKRKF